MTHAKHPLVAAHAPNAAADLIREGLKTEAIISRGESAAERITWSLGTKGAAENLDRFLEAAFEEMIVPRKGTVRRASR
jgi:hypothetical protein